MDWTCVSLLFVCVLCVCFATGRHDARVTVRTEGITRFPYENLQTGFAKLFSTGGKIISVGDSSLYSIDPTHNTRPKTAKVNFCEDETSSDPSNCEYRISVLTDSADGHLLCGSTEENTKCCYMDSSDVLTNCFTLDNYRTNINEPSLLIGDMLYYTLSEKGLYRINKDKKHNIWPMSTQQDSEHKYLKLIALQDQGKVYSFFAAKHKSKDGEPEQWIPRVSQSCMNDRGGPKSHLQNSWTSMIYGRLSCGTQDFTQLIDVATLDIHNDIKVYTLFRNYWNMSAVCVYSMTNISTVFSSSQFNSAKVQFSDKHRPGTCVDDSVSLSAETLLFMMERPEVKDKLKPENGPLLFRHHHYTHIQAEHVQNHTVLLLTLENGRVHKVLEKSAQRSAFIIAEYLPFPQDTKILSSVVDISEKRLYVSSGEELVQIDLQACGVYGNDCNDCVLSRDPYCGWSGSHCTAAAKPLDHQSCDKPQAEPSRTKTDQMPVVYIPPSSTYVLICPETSHHATYQWYHEDGHQKSITRYELSMSRSRAPERVFLHALLLLLTSLHFL